MSDLLEKAQDAIAGKLATSGLENSIKFDITDVGSLRYENGVVEQDSADADVTLTASAEDFQDMFEGNLDPTSAFMTGRLKIDGDMSVAMKLASALS